MKFALGQSLRRLHRLDGERRQLLARAAVTLSCASAVVAMLPFRRAVAYGSAPLGGSEPRIDPAECVWAVETASRRVPLRTMCIEKGIAVQRLLRKAGVDALLHYGARHEPDTGKLQAHVWVTVGSESVIGGDEAVDFKEIATFP